MPFNSPIRFTPKKASPFRVFGLPDAEIEAAREAAKLNKAKETRSVASTIGDMASAGGQAAIGTVQAITDFASPTSAPSNFLRDLPQYWQGIESPQYKARQEANAREMEAIPEGDWLGRGLQTAENVVEDPFGSAAKLTGSMLPFIAAAPLGLPAMTGMGAAVGGGTVRGGIFENVLSSSEQNLLKDPRYAEMRSRMPEQDAKVAFGELMSSFGESGAEIGTGALIGGITGSLGAEASAVKALTRGATRNALTKQAAQLAPTAILKGALSEAGQETFEEGSQQYLANVAAASGGAEIDPWKNVVEGAVEGGLLGLGGGGFGKVSEGLAGRSRLNALNIEEGFVAPPSAKPKLTVQNAEIKSQQALENPSEDYESGEMDPAAIASLSVANPNADLAQVFGYVPPQPEVDQASAAQPGVVAVPETRTDILDPNVPSSSVEPVAPVGPEVGQDQVQPLVAPSEKEIAKAEKEKFKLQEKILKAQQAVDAKLAKEEAKPVVVPAESLKRLSDTIPPESGIQALPIAEGDSAVNRPVEPGGAIEASPALAQSPVDVPNASPAPGQAVENGASQPISVDAAPSPAPSVATSIAQEPIQDAPKVAQAPQQVNPPVRETASISDTNEEPDLESLLQQSVQNPKQRDPLASLLSNKAEPKVQLGNTVSGRQTVYAGDKVQVGDQIGEAVGNQKNGMVTVRYPDGTTKIQRASEVRKLAPEPQSKGDRQELVGKLRDAIPANHPKKAEIDAAIQAFQENDTAENEGAVSRALKDAGLWKGSNPFDTAVDAIAKGQDPVEAVIRQGRSRPEAEKAAKKAESFVNKKKANGTWDPSFERGDKPIPGIHRRMTLADMWEGIVEDFRTTVPKAITQLQLKAEQLLEGPMTEAIWKFYNGIKDSARGLLYRDAYRVNIGKSKFVVADFEGDVDSSVVSNLARITEDLAGRMQSVSRRISTAAGTPVDAFAGFAPSGNLAGVTLGQKVYINPLKHVKGIFSGSRRIARRMLNTLVHELAHANGFSKHDKAFEAEQGRIWDAIKKANLIEGMEVEIAKGLDNELISKLNGIYDTAQKGWYNARYKARKLSRSEGRQSDRAVPRVSTEGDRASGVSPPNGNRESVSGTRKSERGSSEELGTTSEDGRVDEAEAGGADSGRGVLDPKFARAWHGTPHKFDKFQFDDKVRGTGEGAQAYGDGLYFAEDEGVGRSYQYGLARPDFTQTKDGVKLRGELPRRLEEAYDDLVSKSSGGRQLVTPVDAVEVVMEGLNRQRNDALKARDMEWFSRVDDELIDASRFKRNPPKSAGSLYHVDIPDSVVDRMLDWDKPLNQQSKTVREALSKIGKVLDDVELAKFDDALLEALEGDASKPLPKQPRNPSGEDLYREVAGAVRGKSYADFLKMGMSPSDAQSSAQDTWHSGDKTASKILSRLGVPGIKYLDGNSRSKGEGSRNFVVFDAKDVTILTRNGEKVTGQEKTDAIGEMQEQHPETAEQKDEPSFSREPEEDVEEKPTEITLPQDTWSQKRVYEYVDSKAKIQTMMEAVEATTGKRADVDLHEASIAVSSITAHEIKQLNDFHVNPLSEFMKANKISTKEAGRYIWAKENIDGAIDPKRMDESQKIVEEIESSDKADAFNEIDTAVKRIIQVGRGAAIDSGLSTKDNVSIDGAEEGVIQRVIEKAARTVVKANENRFRTQLGTFLAKNPSPEWAINPKKAVGGKTIPYYVQGKKQRIWIKDKVLGEQIESLSDGENSWFMDGVRRMTRGFSVVNTRANPVFPVKNFIRDLMFGLGKIYVDDGPKIMGETWRGLKNAIPTMWKYHKNPNYWKDLPKGSDAYKWGAAAELLYRSGGIPQWFGLPSQDAIKELLDTDIKGFDGSKLDAAYKPFKRFWNGMKMLSEVSEGATRLAYLKTLVDPSESGKQMPIQDAIKKARGITGDFQRHGNKKNMRYAYAFFNSSIQGATAMANLTKELKDGNPRARNLAMFLVGLGMSQALAGMLAGDADGDDQNDYEQIPEYTKNSNLIIPIPGYPVAIPLPYGLNVPIVAGMGIIRTALSDEPDAASKSAINVMHSAMKSFNPMGDEASLMQFISPTVLDPIAQASENLDSLGRKINRDRYYGEEKLPESQITSRKDSAPAKAIASAMNRLGGGDEITPAKISFMDVHPGTIDNTMAWLMGAAGRFVKDSGLAAASAAKGEAPQKIPLWNDFVKTPKNSFYTGRFWEQIEEIRSFKDSARQLDENARREQALELGLDPDTVESMTRADLKKRIQLSKSRSDAISKRIEQTAGQRVKLLPMYEDLRKQISALQKSNDPNADDRIIELVKAANRKYVEATR